MIKGLLIFAMIVIMVILNLVGYKTVLWNPYYGTIIVFLLGVAWMFLGFYVAAQADDKNL